MTSTQKTLLAALSASLFNHSDSMPDLQSVDWRDVFEEAKQQSVTCLAYDALKGHLPRDIDAAWQVHNLKVISQNARVIHEEKALIELLDVAGVPFCILKGSAAAVYYPNPLLRTFGDIDFIVPQDWFDETQALLMSNGYTTGHGNSDDDARHLELSKNGVMLELHHHFSSSHLDMERYIISGLHHIEWAKVGGHTFPMLPKLFNGLVLLAHMRQHLEFGLGLRQVIDWMMYVRSVLDDSFWKSMFCDAAEALGLGKLAITAARMCQLHLGLEADIHWCYQADELLCERLMDSIMLSGNFGRKIRDGSVIEYAAAQVREQGLFRYLQRRGKETWGAYHRHSWLKPFAWFYQISRFIRNGLRMHRSSIHFKNDLKRGSARADLMRDLGLM